MHRNSRRLGTVAVDWAGVGVVALGFSAVVTVAASRGGYFPESSAWLASLTLFPAAVILMATDHCRLSRLDVGFLGLLLAYGSWVLLSASWSVSITRTVFEAQRDLGYFGAALLALLLVRRRTAPLLVAGVLAGVTAVAWYAFLTRVLPDRFVRFDSIAGYRLTDPIGYWNGLGIFAAMGALLALGFAARASNSVARGFASAIPVILLMTVFFTFSRGAWLALALGFLVAVMVDPERLQLLATAIVLAPWSVLAVWLSSRSHSLTTVGSSLSSATSQGRSLLVAAAILSAASGVVGFALAEASKRVRIGATSKRVFAGLLIAVALAGAGGLWIKAGSPYRIATSAWHRLQAPPKQATGNLTNRLFDLSSNGRLDLWSTSRQDFVEHPIRGTGAGTFAYSWAARGNLTARDGHSLYMETLGELGVVGLILIVGVLLVPVAGAARARRSSLLPGGLAAFAAFVVHAGIDWDWELSGVTLVALLSAVGLLAAARRDETELRKRPLRLGLIPLSLALSLLAFVSVLGNVPLGRARDALNASNYSHAATEARRARTWAPWSSEPLRILGEAQLDSGDPVHARSSFRVALTKDPRNWELWLDLALATDGAERRAAAEEARRLNPHSAEVQQVLAAL